jgi:hypothetical protein
MSLNKNNWSELSDKQHVEFANKEYTNYRVGDTVLDKKGNIFGYVSQVINDPDTGLHRIRFVKGG